MLFDCGHRRTQFSFDVAARLLEQGFPPDTISSDASASTYAELAPGLITVMNRWLALGMPLAAVVRATTSHPAAALGLAGELGSLAPGGQAHITVLCQEQGAFVYRDARGGARQTESRLAPQPAISRGQLAEARASGQGSVVRGRWSGSVSGTERPRPIDHPPGATRRSQAASPAGTTPAVRAT